MVAGSSQSFQFFRQNMWFLENNRPLSKFVYEILHYLVLSNHKKNSPKNTFLSTLIRYSKWF